MAAYLFGATRQTDVFLFASAFCVIGSGVVTTVLGTIFLPHYITLLHHEDGAARSLAFANALLGRLSVLALLGGGAILLWPVHVFSSVSRFEPTVLAEQERVLRYFSSVMAVSILNEYLRFILQAREGYLAASASMVLQPAVNLAVIALLAARTGYESLAVGAAVSRTAQLVFLAWVVRRSGIDLWPQFSRNSDLREFYHVARPFWIASIITFVAAFVSDYLASGLPTGELTAVSFAQRIYVLPITLLAMPVIEVLYTRMAMHHARGEESELTCLYSQAARFAIFFFVPLSVLLALTASDISALLLGRSAYSPESLTVTSRALGLFSLSIPLTVLFAINGRIALVVHKTRIPSLFGSLGHILGMAGVWWLVSAFGFVGLPLGRLAIELVYFLPLGFIVVRWLLPAAGLWPIANEFSRVAAATVLALGTAFLASGLTALAFVQGFVRPLMISLIFVSVYAVACAVMRVEAEKEFRSFVMRFR
jgi:putative peptidoglycan lipid II flippase